MAYFEELPNILHPSLLPNQSKVEQRILVKNIFKRSKLRTDIDQAITAFNFYNIKEGMRPDILAEKLYNNSELDWVILTSNNIINIRNQWPLDHNDLYAYMLEKYGSDQNIAGIHHYETKKIVDEYNRTIMSAGLKVDADFTFQYKTFNNLIVNVNPVVAVTNYQYETKLNDEKRRIRVLKPQFLNTFLSEHREIMSYGSSSDFISRKVKGTYNPRISGV
tara:strand:- start:8 stop:667 length:660 start_codon:yes stop_codon:yes gene_type:complete